MIYILDGFGNISLVNKFKLIEDSFLIDIWHTVNNDVLFVTANHGILLRCFNDIKIGSFTFENRIKKE